MATAMDSSLIPGDLLQPFINKINTLSKSRQQAYWYVRRAEEYLRATPLRPVGRHTRAEVTAWLTELGRKTDLSPWQFRQCVEAVGTLMRVAGAPARVDVDWRYWLDGAKALERGHATLGRDNHPLPPPSNSMVAVPQDPQAAFLLAIRRRNLAYRTEQSYGEWLSRFLAFCRQHRLAPQAPDSVRRFLDELVIRRNLSASTQNQALNALVFLYRHVYGRELGPLGAFAYSKRPRRLPVVLTREEVMHLLGRLTGRNGLMASLLYGTGLRLMECLRLRVQDLDFGYRQILIRNAKGNKDRVAPLPERLIEPLQAQLAEAGQCYDEDLRLGFGGVWLPEALNRKWPDAGKSWRWQYVFPAARLAVDPRSGRTLRHHLHESTLQKAVKGAAAAAGIDKRVSCHTLRHYLPFLTMSCSFSPTWFFYQTRE